MSMDDQHIELIRDTIKQGFESTNQKIDSMAEAFKEHTTKDEGYWRQIDEHRGQLRLVKWLAGTGLGGSAVMWILNKLHLI